MQPIHLLDVASLEPFCGGGDEERWSFTAELAKATCPACERAVRGGAASRWAAQCGPTRLAAVRAA
jgi:hypothetical protein